MTELESAAAHSEPPQVARLYTWTVWLGAASALALLVTVVVSLLLQDQQQAAAMRGEDWRAAAEHVRVHYRIGDVVRIAPVWADDPRVFLGEVQMDLTSSPLAEVLDDYARVWVIAAHGRADALIESMPPAYPLAEREALGRAEVLLFEVPASRKPLFDFVAQLPKAKVSRTFPNKPTEPCTTWRKDAWHCGRVDKFLFVSAQLEDMDGEPRRCIYMPPIPDDGWVEVQFDHVPFGERIEGRVGLNHQAARGRGNRGGVTDFAVLVDGKEGVRTQLTPTDPVFPPFTIDTSHLRGRHGKVVFKAHAKDFFDRFLCVTARVPAHQ